MRVDSIRREGSGKLCVTVTQYFASTRCNASDHFGRIQYVEWTWICGIWVVTRGRQAYGDVSHVILGCIDSRRRGIQTDAFAPRQSDVYSMLGTKCLPLTSYLVQGCPTRTARSGRAAFGRIEQSLFTAVLNSVSLHGHLNAVTD